MVADKSGFEDYEVDLLTDLSIVKKKTVAIIQQDTQGSSRWSKSMEIFNMTSELLQKHEEKGSGDVRNRLSEIRTVFELISATHLMKSDDSLKIINNIYQSLVGSPEEFSTWKDRFLWHIKTSDFTSAFNELSNISSKDKALYRSIVERFQNDIIKPTQSYFESSRVT